MRSYYSRIQDILPGDIIFNCSDGCIKAISVAKNACRDCPRPDGEVWKNWHETGHAIDCNYNTLDIPLKHGKYKEIYKEIIANSDDTSSFPFDKNGNGKEGYIYEVPEELSIFFIKEIIEDNPSFKDLDCIQYFLSDEDKD